MRKQGKYTQVFDELVRYVGEFDSGFPRRIRTANRGSIETLQGLAAPNVLPEVYVAFLERMGADHGGLNIAIEGTTNIDDMIQSYWLARQNMAFAKGCSLLTDIISDNTLGLYQPAPESEPEVVVMGHDLAGTMDRRLPYAESLPKLLFRGTFNKYQRRTFQKSTAYTSPDSSGWNRSHVPELEKLAAELGFSRQWFSDAFQYCGKRGMDATLSMEQFPERGVTLVISASCPEEIVRLAKPFQASVPGLEFSQWSRKREEQQQSKP
ncbi:MAG TPA: hypothetical protein VI636_13400 [Candidatus Angelobacter sp.]